MCGRYSLAADLEDVQRRFQFFDSELIHSPRYNIAPTQPVLAVTNHNGRRGSYMRWGLIPSWAKSASVGNRLINARAETVAERPSFRTALVEAGGVWSSQTVSTNGRGPETLEGPCES